MSEEEETPKEEALVKEDEKTTEEKAAPKAKQQKYKEEVINNNEKCNLRIEEIARPTKLHVKCTYKKFKKVLPKRNIKAIILFLREEYAKSPEQMEEDFKEIEQKETEKKCRKICLKEARKKHFIKMNESRRKNMLKILKEILRKYMANAFFHPKHIIMTTRIRRVSNIILKQLCEIRGIPVPQRESTKIRSQLMYSVSDFFAFCVDVIYYEMQVQKIVDYEKLKREKESITGK